VSDCGCEIENAGTGERRLLVTLLAINAVMFGVELAAGIAGDSAGLLADSLDMLADATVYGIALAAVGRPPSAKAMAALLSGYFQIALSLWVAVEVVRRLFGESEPQSSWMMAVGAIALAANVACLAMLAKHRKGEVHLRASFIFSTNDVLANLGVILGGFLVAATGSRLPDLAIGAAVVLLVLRGGLRIVREASRERGLSPGESAA
jgi:cation diffusion facilitator family transporter